MMANEDGIQKLKCQLEQSKQQKSKALANGDDSCAAFWQRAISKLEKEIGEDETELKNQKRQVSAKRGLRR